MNYAEETKSQTDFFKAEGKRYTKAGPVSNFSGGRSIAYMYSNSAIQELLMNAFLTYVHVNVQIYLS